MSFGKMRTPITVLAKKSEVVDTHTTDEFTPILHIRGYVKHNNGHKFFEAAAVNSERLDTVIVRYRRKITDDCRLEYDGARHRIESVMDIENRHVYLEIKCEVVGNE